MVRQAEWDVHPTRSQQKKSGGGWSQQQALPTSGPRSQPPAETSRTGVADRTLLTNLLTNGTENIRSPVYAHGHQSASSRQRKAGRPWLTRKRSLVQIQYRPLPNHLVRVGFQVINFTACQMRAKFQNQGDRPTTGSGGAISPWTQLSAALSCSLSASRSPRCSKGTPFGEISRVALTAAPPDQASHLELTPAQLGRRQRASGRPSAPAPARSVPGMGVCSTASAETRHRYPESHCGEGRPSC